MKNTVRALRALAVWCVVLLLFAVSLAQLHRAAQRYYQVETLHNGTQRLIIEKLSGRWNPELEKELDEMQALFSSSRKGALSEGAYWQTLLRTEQAWGMLWEEMAAPEEPGNGGGFYPLYENYLLRMDEAMDMVEQGFAWSLSLVAVLSAAVGILATGYLLLTERRKRRELDRIVYTDNLTGIYNKEAFCYRAGMLLRRNPKQSYAMVHFDLNNFKYINQVYGYQRGDELLRSVAQAVERHYHDGAICARLYADHFVVLARWSENLAEAIRAEVARGVEEQVCPDGTGPLSCYMGIYIIPQNFEDVNAMLDKAESSLKEAKSSKGCGMVVYDESVGRQIQRESFIAGRMQYALEHGEFLIYLQPKFRVVNGQQMMGAEALVRWDSPEMGLVPPNGFIPLFEENGFIVKLDMYVLEMVCKRLRKQLDEEYGEIVPMAVNFSRVSVYRGSFVQDFLSVVEGYRIPPRFIEVEITETVLGINQKEILQIMQDLQQKGFRIAMDDFGSGYSSLNFLRSLPVDVLKLDKEFLEEGCEENRTMDIIRCVVELGKSLHAQIVCEGVETKAQLEFLKEIGCDIVQGFYFEKPLPLNKFEEKYAA